jgi:hypothetical protein
MFYSIHKGLLIDPTVKVLDKCLLNTFKVTTVTIKVILDLDNLTGDLNVDLVREDFILDAAVISVLIELCCFTRE